METTAEDAISVLTQKLHAKHKELTSYREALSWKFYQGETPDACTSEFDDSTWKLASLPMSVDARKGEAWLRTRVVVPHEIAGIGVAGSSAKMPSSVIIDKIEVYVNSEKVVTADYWTELRGPRVVLSESVGPQEEYVVAVHVLPKYEPVGIPAFTVTYSNVERIAFEIDSFIQELRFARFLEEKLANSVSDEFDLKVLEKEPSTIIEEIEKARSKLALLSRRAKRFKVHLVAHAHIDMNWLWPWDDTVNTIRDTFSTMVKLIDQYPDFHFSQSQAITYKVTEEEFPDLFRVMRRYVKNGNWDPTASMWVEADLNMGGTEALVRQFLQAKRYFREVFGFEPKVCWEPDTFGHIWTMPQLAKKAGCSYYYLMRCGKGQPLFWWEAPDGSRILAFNSVYNNYVTPKNVVDVAIDLHNRYGLRTSMFVYGVGDHGGGATVEDIEAAHEIQKRAVLPTVIFSSTHSFFKQAEKELKDKKLPVIRDEIQFTFDGCYTTHGDIKRYNRVCEKLLVDAEKFSVFSGTYPRDSLRKAWLNTLFNQFHDILDGSGTSEAYIYPCELAEEALKTADQTLVVSLKSLSERIRFSRPGVPIVVFNPLSWDRTDIVKAKGLRHLIPRNPILVSADGEGTPVQVGGDEVLFVAHVPSMGYRTFYLVEGESAEKDFPKLVASEGLLENEFFRLEIDASSGTIRSLFDKVADRFVFKKDRHAFTRPVHNNLLQVLHEVPHSMSAWIIGDISRVENLTKGAKIELVEIGPARATVGVTHSYRDSTVTQHISLCRGVARVDFSMTIDWKEVSNDQVDAPMLKVSFTPILGNSKAAFEIPFGYVERPADGTEVPALRWVDVSDEKYGLSLLNDSKYGFDVEGNTVRMTLVRTSYSPDPKPDQGIHEVKYSVYPHKGGWKEALTFRRGYEVNHPLEAFVVMDRPDPKGPAKELVSFVRVKPDNLVVSCIKLAEDSNDYVVRVYDATGAGAEAEIAFWFTIKEAYETDLTERELKKLDPQARKLNVPFRPFEIKTFRIRRGP